MKFELVERTDIWEKLCKIHAATSDDLHHDLWENSMRNAQFPKLAPYRQARLRVLVATEEDLQSDPVRAWRKLVIETLGPELLSKAILRTELYAAGYKFMHHSIHSSSRKPGTLDNFTVVDFRYVPRVYQKVK